MVRITCSHDDGTRLVMLWYQQRTGSQSMTLIGFGYGTGDPTYEGQYKEEFKLEREDNLKGALVIPTANLSHSAVYFCAASAQWCGLILLPHKKSVSVVFFSSALTSEEACLHRAEKLGSRSHTRRCGRCVLLESHFFFCSYFHVIFFNNNNNLQKCFTCFCQLVLTTF